MPFYEDDSAVTSSIPAPAAPNWEYESSWKDVVPAAFRLENTVGAAYAANFGLDFDRSVSDPSFDPIQHVPPGHEAFAKAYAFADTPGDVLRIRKRIDRELADRETIASGGAVGVVASMAAGVLDLPTLIPVGGAAYGTYRAGGSILKGATVTARAGLLGSTASEAGLQAAEITRTYGESALNIGAATFVGGVLGGAVGALGAKGLKSFDDIVKGVEQDLHVEHLPVTGGSVGAKAAQDLPIEMEGVGGSALARKATEALSFQSPQSRLRASESVEARRYGGDMAEDPLFLAKNEAGVPSAVSVEALARNWNAPLYRSLKGLDDLYAEYALGRERKFGDIARLGVQNALTPSAAPGRRLTYKEFRIEVGKAMRRGDVHDLPEVAKAAKMFRKGVFDPLKDAAIELKLLPEDVSVETAVSYLNRSYDLEKLAQPVHRQQFIETTVQWMLRRQGESRLRAGTFEKEATAFRDDIRVTRRETAAAEQAAFQAALKAGKEEANAAVDRLLAEYGPRIDIPEKAPRTPEQMQAQAKKRAEATFYKQFKKALADDAGEEARTAAQHMAGEVEAFLKEAGDLADDEIIGILKTEVPPPIAGAAGEAAGKTVAEAVIRAREEAMIAAEKTFERSLKKQAKAAADAELPEEATKRLTLELRREVYDQARKAATKAAREAGSELRDKLKQLTKGYETRKKQNFRDVEETKLDTLDYVDTAERLVQRIEGSPAGRLPYDVKLTPGSSQGGKAGMAGALKARAFGIEDYLIEDFLESDVQELAKKYVRTLAPDLELVRKFGDIDLSKAVDDITRSWENIARRQGLSPEAAANPNDPKARAWKSARDSDLRDLLAMRDRIRNVYGVPENPMAVLPRIGDGLLKLNYVTSLGGMVGSAVPDVARPVMIHGFGRVFNDALVPMVKGAKGFKAAAQDIADMGGAADMIANSTAAALSHITDDFSRYTKFERTLGAMADTFGVVSLMAPWNVAMKKFTGIVSQSRMLRAIDAEMAGKISQKEMTYLRAAGIGPDEARAIHAQFLKHGGETDGTRFSGWLEWDDRNASNVFQAAVTRDINRIIVAPGQDLPLVATSGPVGKAVFQFKSFALASTQRVLLSGLQQADMAVLNGLWMSVSLGMLVYWMKSHSAGKETSDDPAKWLVEGIDRSGVTAWFFDVNNTVEKLTRGHVGVNAMLGAEPMSRYASRNWLGALAGPSFGKLGEAGGVVGAAAEAAFGTEPWREADTRAVRRLLPYQNLLGFRHLVDAAESNINQAIGAQ